MLPTYCRPGATSSRLSSVRWARLCPFRVISDQIPSGQLDGLPCDAEFAGGVTLTIPPTNYLQPLGIPSLYQFMIIDGGAGQNIIGQVVIRRTTPFSIRRSAAPTADCPGSLCSLKPSQHRNHKVFSGPGNGTHSLVGTRTSRFGSTVTRQSGQRVGPGVVFKERRSTRTISIVTPRRVVEATTCRSTATSSRRDRGKFATYLYTVPVNVEDRASPSSSIPGPPLSL